jgi:hypothetical protein
MEIRALGGAGVERALECFRAGEPVTYRELEIVLRRAEGECRVRPAEPAEPITGRKALEALTRARFSLGALLASAAPLDAIVGNREPRFVLVRGGARPEELEELYELRGDRLRRLGAPPS